MKCNDYQSSPEQLEFSEELRPAVEHLYNRHLQSLKPWSMHEEIDWGSGEDFKKTPWSPTDYPLPDGVRSAVYVNLLTEDNAPYYTELLMSKTPANHPLKQWNGQWTMEEGQHSGAIRSWVHISRAIDPASLESARRIQMANGQVPQPETLPELLAYVPFQEKATQIAHRNTARHLSEKDHTGRSILGLIAGDEARHYNFYRDLATAGFEINPSVMMRAVANQVINFAMPGAGIPNFSRHSLKIAREGIYDVEQFRNKVVLPTLNNWNIEEITGLDTLAEQARDDIIAHMDKLGALVAKQQARKKI